MGEQHLNLLCHARGEYANNECVQNAGSIVGYSPPNNLSPTSLVSWRVVNSYLTGIREG